MERYLDKYEIANLFEIHFKTVEKRIKEMKECGRYPKAFRKPGRKIYISIDDFEDFITKRANKEE